MEPKQPTKPNQKLKKEKDLLYVVDVTHHQRRVHQFQPKAPLPTLIAQHQQSTLQELKELTFYGD